MKKEDDMFTFEDVEKFASELGGKPVSDLREAGERKDLPHLMVKFRQMPPAIAEAMLAHLILHLNERDHVDPERVFKLLKLAQAGSAAVFAEGGFFSDKPQA